MDLLSQRDSSLEVNWYKEGLRFQCTECGKCCTGSPGYVFLGESDIERLSRHFSLTKEVFLSRFAKKVNGRFSLIDQPGSVDCIFLKNKKCSAYEARPTQCRTFPWWIEQIRDEDSWQKAAQFCEGINHPDAPLISSLEIQMQCLTYLDNLLEQSFHGS